MRQVEPCPTEIGHLPYVITGISSDGITASAGHFEHFLRLDPPGYRLLACPAYSTKTRHLFQPQTHHPFYCKVGHRFQRLSAILDRQIATHLGQSSSAVECLFSSDN